MPGAQLSLFALPVFNATPCLACTKRHYVRHKRKHVLWLTKHYHVYTMKEAAAELGLTLAQVRYLVRWYHIKKRAPNGQRWCGKPRKQIAHIPESAAVAA